MERQKDKFILRWSKRYRATQELGGKCSVCGEDDIFLLDFHHVDPSEKEFGISIISRSFDWNRIKVEIEKCILLCGNCHKRHHSEETRKQFNENIHEIKEKSKVVHVVSRPKLDDDYIYELLKKRCNLTEIAKIMGKNPSCIRDAALRLEIKHKKKLFLTREDFNNDKKKINIEKLIELYNEKHSITEIANYFGCTKSNLYNTVRNLRKKKLIK